MSIFAYIPTFLPIAFPPLFLPAFLPSYLPYFLSSCLHHSYLPVFLSNFQLFLPIFLFTFIPTFLSTSPRPAHVPVKEESTLVTAGIVGPQERVLVMTVSLADVDAVYAPQPVFPLTPNVLRCRLILAAAVVVVVGGDLEEVASLADGN